MILLTLPSSSFNRPASLLSSIPIDKLIHFGLFGIQYILVAKATNKFISHTSKEVLLIYVCVYAVFTECLQLFLKERSFDIFDIIANIMGASIAYLFFNRTLN
jgi:VanZ family protein